MSKITTHVLDTVLGKPAAGVLVQLERMLGGVGWSNEGVRHEDVQWVKISASKTDADGRCGDLKTDAAPGYYRLTFNTRVYVKELGRNTIYPEISITFDCDGASHYHLPLLLSDNSYTTYRGS
jgi:5-hydroxyisourate hydrolase